MFIRLLLLLLNATGIPRLVYRLMIDSRVSFRTKLIIPGSILYFLLPIDLLPDILPVFGRVDDILVLLLSVLLFILVAPPDVVREHLRASSRSSTGDQVIEGRYRFKDEDDKSGC